MFTGIITDIGTVRTVEQRGDRRFEIACGYDMDTVAMGASIACSGCCLTVVEKGPGWFAVDVSAESLSKTTLGAWKPGTRINLERALKVGDELGGHIVSGHVDGVGHVVSVTPEGDSLRWRFRAPDALARFIAAKGSIAIDGVSLTVNEVDGAEFGVNIIPHTAQHTTFGSLLPDPRDNGFAAALESGARVNLEIDMLARYVARLAEAGEPR